jgi:hypothetical protein
VSQDERRRTPRYPFVAVAELINEKERTKMEVRVTELSLNGCYFDMVNPLPDGTPIHVKIYFENEFFEAKGKVIYAQPNIGMGATFEEMPTYAVPVLKKWLLRAMVASKPGA